MRVNWLSGGDGTLMLGNRRSLYLYVSYRVSISLHTDIVGSIQLLLRHTVSMLLH